tara:strand:+ start:45 stop:476 length:432 start_codon:yes stop_codon:yes gene_type:complete
MEAKVKIDYNAAKLVKTLPKMIENLIKSSGDSTADQSRKNIDNEIHKKPLTKMTIKSRLEGNYPTGKKLPRENSIVPLKWTKNLYKGMKGTEKGLSIAPYGVLHNKGIPTGKIKRPKREFIEFKESKKGMNIFNQDLQKNLRK